MTMQDNGESRSKKVKENEEEDLSRKRKMEKSSTDLLAVDSSRKYQCPPIQIFPSFALDSYFSLALMIASCDDGEGFKAQEK